MSTELITELLYNQTSTQIESLYNQTSTQTESLYNQTSTQTESLYNQTSTQIESLYNQTSTQTEPLYNQTSTQNEPSFNLTRFIVLETSVAIFTLCMLYLLVALFCYEWRKSRLTSTNPQARAEENARFALLMRIASITAVVFTLGRLLCEHYELLAQFTGVHYDYCDIIVKTKVVLSTTAVFGIGAFLWIRQRFCYSDPAMAHLSSSATRWFSWISLVLLFMVQLVTSVLFLATRFYKLTYRGCYNYYTTIPADLPWIFASITLFSSQIMLLFLFIYPLIRHKFLICSHVSSQYLLPVIKRASATSSVCIITDIISCLLILMVKDANEIIPTLAYDVSLVTNVFCVIFSFSDWRSRLFALFGCLRHDGMSTIAKQPSFCGRLKSTKLNAGADSAKSPLPSTTDSIRALQSSNSQQNMIVLNVETERQLCDINNSYLFSHYESNNAVALDREESNHTQKVTTCCNSFDLVN